MTYIEHDNSISIIIQGESKYSAGNVRDPRRWWGIET